MNPFRWFIENADNNAVAEIFLILFALFFLTFPFWFLMLLVKLGEGLAH